jgi:hypothetical protein
MEVAVILRFCFAVPLAVFLATAQAAAAPVLPVLYELEGKIADPGPFTGLEANASFGVKAIVDPTGDDSGILESYSVTSATLAIGDETATFSGSSLTLTDLTGGQDEISLRLDGPSDPSAFGGAFLENVSWQGRGGDALLDGVAALQTIAIADVTSLNRFNIFGRDAEGDLVGLTSLRVTGIEVSEVPLPASALLLAPPLAALAWRASAQRRSRRAS